MPRILHEICQLSGALQAGISTDHWGIDETLSEASCSTWWPCLWRCNSHLPSSICARMTDGGCPTSTNGSYIGEPASTTFEWPCTYHGWPSSNSLDISKSPVQYSHKPPCMPSAFPSLSTHLDNNHDNVAQAAVPS